MAQRTRERVRTRKKMKSDDTRVQREMAEMKQTHDLREIDDDVEDAATLYEWEALEHRDHPKSPRWFVVLAVATTLLVAFFIIMANYIGSLTTAVAGGLLYYLAQQKPRPVRYRIMVDGVALNNTLYHYRDLEAFNIIYEPGEAALVLLRSTRRFVPLVTMEIGEADPMALRDLLLEFLPEDPDVDEPMIDVIARRVGF